jgi:hypothetical protein
METEHISLVTRAKDNRGYDYPVYITRSYTYHINGKLALVFKGAPSGWHLSDLKGITEDKLAIDFGQDWYCINIQEIIAEIRGFI